MSAFETFVNTELPCRPALLTYSITSYDGDPNSASAPDTIKNAPAGSLFIRNTGQTLWRKRSTTPYWQCLESEASMETMDNMDFYVNASSGSDSNAGTASAPFATITKALDSVPRFVKHAVTINIAAGTYTENLTITHTVARRGSLIIQGTSFLAVTPATGPGSGTFTSNSGRILTLTGAGWTVNDLAGKWLKITSGSTSGNYYTIVSNTATGIELPQEVSSIGNASFEIYTFGATIVNPSGGDVNSSAIDLLDGGRQDFNMPAANLNYQTVFKYLNITNTDATKVMLVRMSRYGAEFFSCNLEANSTYIVYANEVKYDGAKFTNCRLYNSKASTSSYGIASQYTYVTLARCYLKGPGGVNGYAGLFSSSYASVNLTSSLAEYWNNNGAMMATNNGAISMTTSLIRNCKYGALLSYVRDGYFNYSGSSYIQSSSYDAIALVDCSNAYAGPTIPSSTSAVLYATGNRNGVLLSNSNNCTVRIINASDISSNSGFGFLFETGGSVRNNYVHVSSNLTMTSNTSGDFALDGATNTSLATLRADPDKIVTDTSRYNSIGSN